MKERKRGFTLIELLIVVAILGLLAAIAIPALKSAIQRARQKRTMAELRSIATAISSYATDFPFMPQVGPGQAELLAAYVVPTYTKFLSGLDGWQNPILYAANGLEYTLVSTGSDGTLQSTPPGGVTTSFSDNIIISNGVFVQWPDGMQTN